MKYRRLNLNEDYDILKGIWEKSKLGQAPPIEMLTPNGIVAETDEGLIVGAIFQFYILNTIIVLIGFPILDSSLKENRSEIIDKLYEIAERTAEYQGYTVCQSYSNLPFIDKRLERTGWVSGDVNVKQYIKLLK